MSASAKLHRVADAIGLFLQTQFELLRNETFFLFDKKLPRQKATPSNSHRGTVRHLHRDY